MRIIADWRLSIGNSSAHKCLIFLTILTLSGCVSTPRPPIGELAPDFVASGKISFRSPNGNHTASFKWTQYVSADERQQYAVEVWGPLGQGRTQLRGNSQQMSVARGDEILAVGTPEEVMTAYLGWVMPIDLLPAWLQGEGVDPENSVLDVAGWRVEFSRFSDQQSNGAMPRPGRLDARLGSERIIVLIREFLQ